MRGSTFPSAAEIHSSIFKNLDYSQNEQSWFHEQESQLHPNAQQLAKWQQTKEEATHKSHQNSFYGILPDSVFDFFPRLTQVFVHTTLVRFEQYHRTHSAMK